MGGINLSAVVFALIIVLWVVYALPGIARRRDILGEAQAVVRERGSETVQVLSAPPALSRRTDRAPAEPNGVTMTQQRVLAAHEKYRGTSTRPVAATAPSAPPLSEAFARAQRSGRRQRQVRTAVLVALAAAALATLIAAIASPLPFWVPLVFTGALALFVVGLRRAEVSRLDAMHRVAELRAEVEAARRDEEALPAAQAPAEDSREPFDLDTDAPDDTNLTAPDSDLDTDDEVSEGAMRPADNTWTPVPVPTPSYLLKDEAETVYQRLAARRPAPFVFEAADVEDQEWADEVAVGGAVASLGSGSSTLGRADLRMAPQEHLELDFDLDQVLARRRA